MRLTAYPESTNARGWSMSFGWNAIILGVEVHKRVVGVHLGPLTVWKIRQR